MKVFARDAVTERAAVAEAVAIVDTWNWQLAAGLSFEIVFDLHLVATGSRRPHGNNRYASRAEMVAYLSVTLNSRTVSRRQDRCVYRKFHPAMISVSAGEIPCSCAGIPCSVEKIPCSVA